MMCEACGSLVRSQCAPRLPRRVAARMVTGDLIEQIAAQTSRAVTERYADPALCILSTAVFTRACDYFGIEAVPMPVETVVFNAVAADWVRSGRDLDEDGGVPCFEAGGYVVQIDSRSQDSDRYAGHLVALVDGVLVDANFGQFSRPEHGMELPAYAAFDLAGHDWPSEPFGALVDETTVIYSYLPDAPDWRRAPDWTDRKAKPIAGDVIRAVRAAA